MIRLPAQPMPRIGAPTVSAEAAAAPAASLGRAAQAIASVSDSFLQVAQQTQQLENARRASELRRQLSENYAQLSLDLANEPDPEKHLTTTRDFLAQYQGTLQGLDLPPALAAQVNEQFEDFASRAVIDTASRAAALSQKRALLAAENEIQAARRLNDPEAHTTAVHAARDAGIILPEQADAEIARYAEEMKDAQVEEFAMTAPAEVLQMMKDGKFAEEFPGLTPARLRQIQNIARATLQDRRSEEIELLETALAQGKLTDKEIAAAEYLTARDRAAFTKAITKEEAMSPPTAEQHAAAWGMLLELRSKFQDPSLDAAEYAAAWNETRTILLESIPREYQGDLRRELSYRDPANRSAGGSHVQTSAPSEYRTLAAGRLRRALQAGSFGSIADDAPAETRKAAYTAYERAVAATMAYLRANPAATIEDVQTYTDSLAAQIIDGGATTFFPDIPDLPAPDLESEATGFLDPYETTDPTIPPLPTAGQIYTEDPSVLHPLEN
jgi:hypothetical protein